MANLVWAVEAVLLGVWGFVVSLSYSTRFHQFISFTQLIISSITLFFHALIASRAPTRAFAVSQAYACAVAAIGLMYVVVLMDTDYYDVAFGSATLLGSLPLGAEIGLAWLVLLIFGAVGMCVQDVNNNQKTALMMHPYGYHMVISLQCLMLIATKQSMLSIVGLCILWALYLVLQFVSRCFYSSVYAYKDTPLDPVKAKNLFSRIWHSVTYPICRIQTVEEITAEEIISLLADSASEGVFIMVVAITMISATGSQGILCIVLLTIAVLQQVNWLYFVDWILGDYEEDALPSGGGWRTAVIAVPAAVNTNANAEPSAPPMVSGEQSSTTATNARFRQPDLHIPLQWRDKTV
jgi:hypothetical protein